MRILIIAFIALLAGCGGHASKPSVAPCYIAERNGWADLEAEELPNSLWARIQEDGLPQQRVSYHGDNDGSYFVCFQDPYCSSEVWTFRQDGDEWVREDPGPLICE